MLPHHDRFGHSLSLRGADIVGAENVDHIGACLAHDRCRKSEANGKRRHDHFDQVFPKSLADRREAGSREPVKIDREDDDQHHCQPEVRHRYADHGNEARDCVDRAVAVCRGQHAHGKRNGDCDKHGKKCQLKGNGQARHNLLCHRRPVQKGDSEITLQDVLQPPQVLNIHGVIQAKAFAQRFHFLCSCIHRTHRIRRIARHDIQQ